MAGAAHHGGCIAFVQQRFQQFLRGVDVDGGDDSHSGRYGYVGYDVSHAIVADNSYVSSCKPGCEQPVTEIHHLLIQVVTGMIPDFFVFVEFGQDKFVGNYAVYAPQHITDAAVIPILEEEVGLYFTLGP